MTMFRFFSSLLIFFFLFAASPAGADEVRGLSAEASSWKEWGAPGLLVDGDVSTAWVGGLSGVGPGKRITVTLPRSAKISRVRIANGNQGKGKFDEFRCVTSGVLRLPDRAVHFFTLKPEAGEQDIVFPPVSVRSFDILIADVAPYSGSVLGDMKVAVSEVRVFTDTGDAAATVSSIPEEEDSSGGPGPSSPAAKPDTMPFFSALKPGVAWLKGVVRVPAGETFEPGVVHPDLGAEFVSRIRQYYRGLVTLSSSILDTFSPDIRDRERGAMLYLRGDMQRLGRLEALEGATVNLDSLQLGKPVVRGDAAMVPVEGVLQYSTGGTLFAVPVNALFSFARTDDGWLINGVQKQ